MLKFHFKKHMKNRHFPKELREKYKCIYCEFTSVDKSYLRTHQKTHENPENFSCHCGKDFSNKHLLAAHQNMVHIRKYRHVCSFCPKAYPNLSSLREHVLTQHTKKDIRNEVCKQCSKAFITQCKFNYQIYYMLYFTFFIL